MSIESIVGTTLAAGGGGVMVAVANAFVNRRKRGLDVTEQIERVAGSMIDRVVKDNEELRAENEKLQFDLARTHQLARESEGRVDGLQQWAAEQERAVASYHETLDATFRAMAESFAVHVRFDRDLVDRLRAHGETDLPEPPPLLVPGVPTPPDGLRVVPEKRST